MKYRQRNHEHILLAHNKVKKQILSYHIYIYICMYAISKDMSRANELRVKDTKNVVKKIQCIHFFIVYVTRKDTGG